MKKFIWAGPHPKGKTWTRLRDGLEETGLLCVRKWERHQDVDYTVRCDFVICATGNPMYKRVSAYAKKHKVKMVMPTGKSLGAVRKVLRDHDLLPDHVGSLHGFHDDDAAAVVNPVTTPLLTPEDMKKLTQAQARAATEAKEKEEADAAEEAAAKKEDDEVGDDGSGGVPVWVEGGRVRMHVPGENNAASRPVFVGGDFHASIAAAARALGVGSGLVSNRMTRDAEPRAGGAALRWATLAETVAAMPGAWHDASRDKGVYVPVLRKPPELAVWREGSVVVTRNPKTGRAQRPVCVEGEPFASVTTAAAFLDVRGGSLTTAIQKRRTICDMAVRYATLDEAMTLPGAKRDEGRDRRQARSVFGRQDSGDGDGGTEKAVAVAAPVVRQPRHVTAVSPSRLVAKLAEIVAGDKPVEVKVASIDVLLDYERAGGKLTNKVREIVTGAEGDGLKVAKIEVLLDYELSS